MYGGGGSWKVRGSGPPNLAAVMKRESFPGRGGG
jgi:hypothetical protein